MARFLSILGLVIIMAIGLFIAVVEPRWPIRVIAGYWALAFGLMAAAYALDRPQMLMKQPDGRLPILTRFIFGPYLLLNGVIFLVQQLLTREPKMDEVLPGLFLGRRLTDAEAAELMKGPRRFHAVLDLTCEFAEARPLRKATAYRCVPVLDRTPPSPEQLVELSQWLEREMAIGPVYVHCALGHGRSATVAAAFLVRIGHSPRSDHAIAELQRIRPRVRLETDQRRALDRFCDLIPRASDSLDTGTGPVELRPSEETRTDLPTLDHSPDPDEGPIDPSQKL